MQNSSFCIKDSPHKIKVNVSLINTLRILHPRLVFTSHANLTHLLQSCQFSHISSCGKQQSFVLAIRMTSSDKRSDKSASLEGICVQFRDFPVSYTYCIFYILLYVGTNVHDNNVYSQRNRKKKKHCLK